MSYAPLPGHGPPRHPGPPPANSGANEGDYKAKYNDLKKRVQEIEVDNDRMHLQILGTKRNIQRMRVERAILLERLAGLPPLPHRGDPRHGEDVNMEEPLANARVLQDLARQGVARGVVAPTIEGPPMGSGHRGLPPGPPAHMTHAHSVPLPQHIHPPPAQQLAPYMNQPRPPSQHQGGMPQMQRQPLPSQPAFPEQQRAQHPSQTMQYGPRDDPMRHSATGLPPPRAG